MLSEDRDTQANFFSKNVMRCYHNHLNIKNKIQAVLENPKTIKFSGFQSPSKLKFQLANVSRQSKMNVLRDGKL